MGDSPERIKVVLLGDSEVGKTSLLVRYIKGTFVNNRKRSAGATFLSKLLEFNDDRVFVNFWDTAGEERYRAIAPNYYRRADGAVLVYDVTNRNSFNSVQMWIDELVQKVENVSILVVGNKSDLSSQREISRQEGKKFAEKNNCEFFETSAKDNANVSKMFYTVAQMIVDKIRGSPSRSMASRRSSGPRVSLNGGERTRCINCKT